MTTDTIQMGNRTYRVDVERDDNLGAPWEEHDGHGVVSDWTTRDKRAGEWILISDRTSRRFYDVPASLVRARADGWGLNDTSRAALAVRLKREPTASEVSAEAVRLDYEHLRKWCADGWYWCGVCVTDITDNKHAPIDYTYAMGGMESTDEEGINTLAQELAEQAAEAYGAAHRFADAMACGI